MQWFLANAFVSKRSIFWPPFLSPLSLHPNVGLNVWTYKCVLGSEDSQLKLYNFENLIVWYTLYFAAIQQPLLWLTSAIIYLVQFSCIYDSWMTVLGSILCLLISFLFLILDCNIRYYFCTPLFTCFDFYKLAKKKKKKKKEK